MTQQRSADMIARVGVDDAFEPTSAAGKRKSTAWQIDRFNPSGILTLTKTSTDVKGNVAMAKKSKLLTTSKFSQLSGISASTLNKWIRDGKIKGEKQAGRWMIGEDQLKSKTVREFGRTGPTKAAAGKKKPAKAVKKSPAAAKKPAKAVKSVKPAKPAQTRKKPAAAAKAYTIDEFSAMTYLTDRGVRQFLKNGRLKGEIDAGGSWKVFAENLLDPRMKHLLR